jgi:alpha-galactosidase
MEFEIASPPLTCSTVNFGMFISMLMKPIRAAGIGLLLISSVAAQHTASHNKVAQPAPSSGLAQTPPMGWNSWDSYGLTVNEEQFRQNMVVLSAQLKEFGWQYVVVDEGWYLQNPESASKPETLRYTVNPRGQYEPALGRFPSSKDGAGFKSLADAAHADGLKFGIHIIRGIPKQTVTANTRIGQTGLRAKEAADATDVCPWNPDNFGVKANAAGQAWYDALMKQYAAWGVDFLKVDCIASHPYKAAEIKMIHRAIQRTGRPMLLSLSPGPTALENAAEVAANAQMWRISDDVWDHWDKGKETSQGIKAQFALAASWEKYARPGNWPDADMLPIGELSPAPGEGAPRTTRLTEDEQRTMLILWCIARSPLFLGANLTKMDSVTKLMLTNPGLIAVDQQSVNNKLIGRDGDVVAWTADSTTGPSHYLALFNLGDSSVKIESVYGAYGFPSDTFKLRDVWERKELGEQAEVAVELPAHGSILLELKP